MISTLVKRHFHHHCRRSPMQFTIWTALESLAVAYPIGIVTENLSLPAREDFGRLLKMGPDFVLSLMIIEAPIIETVWFQLLPILILRCLRVSFHWQVRISTFLFFWAHLPNGLSTGICAGLIGGFYLAFGFAFWARQCHPLLAAGSDDLFCVRSLLDLRSSRPGVLIHTG